MTNRFALVLFCLLISVVLGCGGASTNQSTKKKSIAQGEDAPFGDVNGVDDLRAPSDRTADGKDGETYGPKDIRVPGSEYGKVSASQKAAQECGTGKKGKKCKTDPMEDIPNSEGIAEQMAGIPWGLHYKHVIKMFEKKIKENYAEDLKLVTGEVEEDRIRSKMMREINRLKKSYTKFDGQRTGFEGDVIGGEFTHKNKESMLKWDAGKYVEYMFFINDRFWKRVRTFRKDSFAADITFDDYVSTLMNRFGDGRATINDRDELVAIAWQNKDTLAIAEDRTDMFGVFSLSFIAKVTNSHLSRLRPNAAKDDDAEKKSVSHIVSTVTSGDVNDRNSAVIDNYTAGESSSSASKLSFDSEEPAPNAKTPKSGDGSSKETKKKDQKKDQLDDLDLF
jgi:hypothetical protein